MVNCYFNSIKVRLERSIGATLRSDFRNFNSIKVRLEHWCARYSNTDYQFQFHKGTIRTVVFDGYEEASLLISIHKGTIRTSFTFTAYRASCYFNSIKVRLELSSSVSSFAKITLYFNSIKVRLEHVDDYTPLRHSQFQFHKGTIRTLATEAVLLPTIHFNSIKVRLERWCCWFSFRCWYWISIP